MKAPAFDYHAPESLADLTGLLAGLENAKILAGGQSLMPMLNMRYVQPDHVIDINRVAGLDVVAIEGDRLQVGALTRQRSLERDPTVRARAPIFAEALRQVGHFQTRSRGTVGGSLCHLDPAAELVGLAALFDARMSVAGPNGVRDIPFAAWVQAYMTPALAVDEALIGIAFELWPEAKEGMRKGEAFIEFARRHGDFAIAGAAVRVALDGTGAIARLAIALIGVGVAPVRLSAAEAALNGAQPGREAFDFAAAQVAALDVMSDAHVSAEYRKTLATVLTRRAFAAAVDRALGPRHDHA